MNINSLQNTNELISFLGKSPDEFTKRDTIIFIKANKIEFVNFMYPAADHKLKTLNFVINSEEYLDSILTFGERVDGSSLFPEIEASGSDLYVLPRFRTAFIDPFATRPTLAMLCSFFDRNGDLLETSSEFTLRKADRIFTEKTGMKFQAMVE
ncbi:MAG: glutamine synthetase, partial [Prevotellaceae bacterium]|nr:glutamine synthetase [Prevotellaceae bacterium]